MAKKRPSAASIGKKPGRPADRPLTVNLSEQSIRAIAAATTRGAAAPGSAATTRVATTAAEKTTRAYTSGVADAQDRMRRQAGTRLPGGGGGAAVRGGRAAEGMVGAGGAGGAGAALSRVAVPLAIASQALEVTKALAIASHDRYSTNAQLGRNLVRELVPGGAKIQGYMDAFTGRAAGMEQARIEEQVRAAGIQERLGVSRFNIGYNPQQAGKEAAANAYTLPGAYVAPPVVNRSTAAGEQQYRDAMRLLPLRQKTVQLDREGRAATAERLAAERELLRVETQRANVAREKSSLDFRTIEAGRGFWTGSGEGYENLLRQQGSKNEELRGMTEQRRAAAEAVAAAKAREATASAEAARARVREDLIGKAENLQERADYAKSGAVRLGQMSPLDRQQAAAILQMARTHGTDALPPEWKAQLSGIAPMEANKLFERAGAADPTFRRLQQSGVVDFPGRPGQSPSDIQREADTLRERAGAEEFRIDSRASADIAAASRGLGQEIARAFAEFRRLTVEEIYRNIKLGRN